MIVAVQGLVREMKRDTKRSSRMKYALFKIHFRMRRKSGQRLHQKLLSFSVTLHLSETNAASLPTWTTGLSASGQWGGSLAQFCLQTLSQTCARQSRTFLPSITEISQPTWGQLVMVPALTLWPIISLQNLYTLRYAASKTTVRWRPMMDPSCS